MKLFKDVQDCIDKVGTGLSLYPNINSLVNANDLKKWATKLDGQSDFEDYLFNPDTSRLNLLNVAALIGHSHITGYHTPISVDLANVFQKLNDWLGLFPPLLTDKTFLDKIRNLSEYSFISCLSELSLAATFKNIGFEIDFEIKFPQLLTKNIKDIDLEIKDAFGNAMYLEVYMPVSQTTEDGFFDIHNSDYYFNYKVSGKLSDKFANAELSHLTGKVLLAVNIAYFEDLYRNFALPVTNNEEVYQKLKFSLPDNIDGLLFFAETLKGDRGMYFDRILLKD